LLHFLLADDVVYNKIINLLSSALMTLSIASMIESMEEGEERGMDYNNCKLYLIKNVKMSLLDSYKQQHLE
jgi:hypothetical protein